MKLIKIPIFIFTIISLNACVVSSDKPSSSGSAGNDSPSVSNASKKVFKSYDFKKDAIGRRVVALVGPQVQLDLSEAIEYCNGKAVQSFKVLRSNGVMELETSGGVPHMHSIEASQAHSPYKVVISLADGETKTFKF